MNELLKAALIHDKLCRKSTDHKTYYVMQTLNLSFIFSLRTYRNFIRLLYQFLVNTAESFILIKK